MAILGRNYGWHAIHAKLQYDSAAMGRIRQYPTSSDLVSGPPSRADATKSHCAVAWHSGDSYSAVGYVAGRSLRPRDEEPLGIAFPGNTYAEPQRPNWVGHLVTNYSINGPLLVYDYAVGGDDVSGVGRQIQDMFLPRVGKKPSWAPWSSLDTLFSGFTAYRTMPSC